MALTQVEPYIVDSTASYTVGNISTGNIVASGNLTVNNSLILGNLVLTANNFSSTGRALYMGIVFGG